MHLVKCIQKSLKIFPHCICIKKATTQVKSLNFFFLISIDRTMRIDIMVDRPKSLFFFSKAGDNIYLKSDCVSKVVPKWYL